jgi:uncharacterized protein
MKTAQKTIAKGAAAAAAGVVFGLGLTISGMTQPGKVIAFLDFAGGRWDPSLAFVMIGAIAVSALGYRAIERRGKPLLGDHLAVSPSRDVDLRLVAGAAIFGVGWGISGYCPGPAVTSTIAGSLSAIVTVVSMMLGSWIAGRLSRPAARQDDRDVVIAAAE